MAGHKKITAEEAARIWFLYKKGLKYSEIAALEKKSANCCRNCAIVYAAVEKGDYSEAKAYCTEKNRNAHLLQLACAHFGVAAKAEAEQTAPQQVQEKTKPDNTLHYLVSLLGAQKRTNELLEKLCAAWGVEV